MNLFAVLILAYHFGCRNASLLLKKMILLGTLIILNKSILWLTFKGNGVIFQRYRSHSRFLSNAAAIRILRLFPSHLSAPVLLNRCAEIAKLPMTPKGDGIAKISQRLTLMSNHEINTFDTAVILLS